MADSTISFRATDETRSRLETLAKDLGSSQKELFERMLNTYETAISSQEDEVIPALAPLKKHVHRIEEIYVAMFKDYKDKQKESVEEILKLRDEVKELKAQLLETKKFAEIEVNEAQEQLKIAITETAQIKKQTEKELSEMSEKVINAEKERKQYAEMIDIAKERATYAEEKAASFEKNANLADQYKQEKLSLQSEIEKSQLVQANVEQLLVQLAKQEEDYESALRLQKEDQQREIDTVRREEHANCKDQVLELKDKHMSEVDRIRREYEDRIQRLLDRLEKEQLSLSSLTSD